MKKVLLSIFALFMLVCVVGCSNNTDLPSSPTNDNTAGGYTEDRDLTAEDKAVFEEATSELAGVGYEPLKVATQVVAGTNYRFLCKATTVSATPEEKTVHVFIFDSLDENEKPKITEIVDVE